MKGNLLHAPICKGDLKPLDDLAHGARPRDDEGRWTEEVAARRERVPFWDAEMDTASTQEPAGAELELHLGADGLHHIPPLRSGRGGGRPLHSNS